MSTRSSRANDAEKHAKTLQELLKLPENKFCADCGDKGPRWASVNLGIFICMRCAGIHRQMGTHVTKVKSTTLDSWIDEWVERMAQVGNEKGNQIWEATNPSRKPNPQSNQPDLERYLRDKYERGLFKADSGHSDRHDRHNDHRHERHNEHRHEHERRREPKNTDFPPDNEFEARFDSREEVIGSSRSQASKQPVSSQPFKIQIKTGGPAAPPPLPVRNNGNPQPAAFSQPTPVQAPPKIDSLLDWSDPPAPVQAAPVQQSQAPTATHAQANGAAQQDNFAAFASGGFGDFNSLAAGKSTEDKKNDIMKMFESTPNPMMGMNPGMGMGMGMNPGMGMGMGMNPNMGMGMGMNPGMGMNSGMGMNPNMGMGMNAGMGMNPGMGMNQNMGMGMMGGNQMRGAPMGGPMGMGNPMAAQQQQFGNPQQQQQFGHPQQQQQFGHPQQQQQFGHPQQQQFGHPQQGNQFAGMFGM
eukprot:c8388_g1_i1.p1 GENE.c8388_g1_i1~~c8388_g1_i1.p1  ORF type:complete len:469 (-),score=87.04 c8388_g1_i1:218-1624(-)